MKTCSECKLEKETHEFRSNRNQCRVCEANCKLRRLGKERRKPYQPNSKPIRIVHRYDESFWQKLLPMIIADYQSGLGCVQLGIKYNISDETIRKQLKKAGVQFRTREENNILQSIYQQQK